MKPRTLLAAGMLAALAFVVPAPAQAYQTITFALVVPCNDADGVSSNEVLPIGLPKGIYAYTITGACDYSTTSTPPCYVSVHTVILNGCTNLANPTSQVLLTGCWGFNVQIDGQCVGPLPAGTIAHPGGPMTARYVEAGPQYYANNAGAFVVTLTFTPF